MHNDDAAIVRSIFERFVRICSAAVLARELRAEGVRTKRGKLVDKGCQLLNNRTNLGMAVNNGTAYPPLQPLKTSETSDPARMQRTRFFEMSAVGT